MELKMMYIAMRFHFSSAPWQVALTGLWRDVKLKKAVPLWAPTETDCASVSFPQSIRCLCTPPLTVAFQHYWSVLDCFRHGLCIILVLISKKKKKIVPQHFVYVCISLYLYFCIHVHAYVYIHVKYVYFASLYLSNCDVLGSRPKVCYCNTFSEKRFKIVKKRCSKCCCSQRFYACTAVVKLQRNH